MQVPVALLREVLRANEGGSEPHYRIDRESKKVILNTDVSPTEFHLDSPSGFENHSIETILNLWERRNDSYADYLKWVTTTSMEPVSFVHRKLILDFLTGTAQGLPGFTQENPVPRNTSTELNPETIEKCLKISSHQRQLNSPNTELFIPSSRQKDFSEILSVSRAKFTSDKAKKSQNLAPRTTKQRPRIPIIIVPSGVQPMINMFNVKSFLVDGLYIPMSEIPIYQGKPECVVIERLERSSQSAHKKYRVIDSVDSLDSDDWNQVVAAFVTGQTWQFSKWKWKDPAILFEKMKGFCVRYTDDPPPGMSGQWAIKELLIHRTWRHNDRSATNMFWNEVEAFAMQTRKPAGKGA